jgi:hypothetical protein
MGIPFNSIFDLQILRLPLTFKCILQVIENLVFKAFIKYKINIFFMVF